MHSFVQSHLHIFESEGITAHTYSYHKKWLMLHQGKYLSLSVNKNIFFIRINWVHKCLTMNKEKFLPETGETMNCKYSG